MRFNLNNPTFLQEASNIGGAGEYISFVDSKSSNPQVKLSCEGDLQVISTYNGEQITQTLSNLTEQTVSIQADLNTTVTLIGKVTYFSTLVTYPGGTVELTNLDVSKAKSLEYINCSVNQLTSLDVSANTALTDLDCSNNQLTSLDVSANTALADLYCGNNQLTSLDVSANTALTELYCSSNQLTSLDVSANTALTELYCSNNPTLLTIDGIGVNEDVATNIASAITDATSVDGTVTLRQGDEYNQTIIDAAMEKGWDVQYYQ